MRCLQRRSRVLVLVAAVAVNVSSTAHAAPSSANVSGSATYRERIALTPEAMFEVTLEDVSRADAPGEVIARVTRKAPGQVPLTFEFNYDSRKLKTDRKYVVRASVLEQSKVRFTGTRPFSVPAPDRRGGVSILMNLVAGEGQPGGAGAELGDVPATFAGLLPCADCVGIRYQINLLPGHAYMQRTTYLRDGSDQGYYEVGAWTQSEDGRTLTLDGGKVPTRWAVEEAGTLRKLDISGKPIQSGLSYTLTRSPSLMPMQPRMRLTGMFRAMADAPRFRECRSRLSWPVEMTADYRALERAYTAQRLSAGAELKASVQGRIEDRPKVEGPGTEPVLVVEAFLAVTPGETCEEAGVQSGLVNTRWCPVRIGEKDIRTSAQREAWIMLDPKARKFTGSAGCNRVNGSFEVQGESLRFGRAASTMAACPEMETEHAFLSALENTRRFWTRGRTLELLDGDGRVVARLEERTAK